MLEETRGVMRMYLEHVLSPAVALMERRTDVSLVLPDSECGGPSACGSSGGGGGGGGRSGMVLTLADVTSAAALVGRRETGTARWAAQPYARLHGCGASATSPAVLWLFLHRLDDFEPGLVELVKATVWARPVQMALRQYGYAPFIERDECEWSQMVTVAVDDSERTIYNKKAFALARAFSDEQLGATDPVFDFDHFALAVAELAHELASGPDQLPPQLEWAAVVHLNRMVEQYLVRLLRHTRVAANHAGATRLEAKDMQLAKRLRGKL
jgi:histone H3/H4